VAGCSHTMDCAFMLAVYQRCPEAAVACEASPLTCLTAALQREVEQWYINNGFLLPSYKAHQVGGWGMRGGRSPDCALATCGC
jgi:hypothetical protein